MPETLATWLRKRSVAKASRARDAGWQFVALPLDRVTAFETDLRREVGAVRAIGAEPVLAHTGTHSGGHSFGGSSQLLVAWERFNRRATGRVLIAFDAAARAATLRVAADSVILVADAALAATAQTPFADYTHLNEHAAAVAAGTTARQVEELIGR